MDQHLISSLKKLAALKKTRDACDAEIIQLDIEESKLVFNEEEVSCKQEIANNAAIVLKKAEGQVNANIRLTKALAWLAAVVFIGLGSAIIAPILAVLESAKLSIFFATLFGAAISAFFFYRIAKGGGGCLKWGLAIIFGLEAVAYAGYTIREIGIPAALFFACLACGLIVGITVSCNKSRKERVTAKIHKQIMASQEYQDAVKKDNQILEQNRQRKRAACRAKESEIQQQREAIGAKIAELRKRREEADAALRANTIFPYKDLDLLDRVIGKLEGMRANTVSEALRECDAEDKASAAAAVAAANAARVAEANRKRNSPGIVYVKTMEDGKGRNAEVYVDGGYYGSINYVFGWTSISLDPGSHTIAVVIKSANYYFRSAPQSVYVEGDSETTLTFTVVGYNNIVCTRY